MMISTLSLKEGFVVSYLQSFRLVIILKKGRFMYNDFLDLPGVKKWESALKITKFYINIKYNQSIITWCILMDWFFLFGL